MSGEEPQLGRRRPVRLNRSTGTFGRFVRVTLIVLSVLFLSGISFLLLNVQMRLEVKNLEGDDGGESGALKFNNCANIETTKGHYVSSHGLMSSANYIFMEDEVATKKAMQSFGFLQIFQTALRRYALVPNCVTEIDHQFVTVYVQSGLIPTFARYSHSLPFSYALLSGDDDNTMPQDVSRLAFDYVIESPLLVKWYTQNVGIPEDDRNKMKGGMNKLYPMPIGLDYHTLATRPEKVPHWGPPATEKEQEKELNSILKKALPLKDRQLKVYSTFHLNYLPDSVKPFTDREEAFRDLPSALVDHEQKKITRRETWEKQAQYSFVASPHGRGLDCHRTWEALTLGCIVIVKSSSLDSLYAGLPVLIVDKWKDVTAELLQEAFTKYTAIVANTAYEQTQGFRSLHLQHWIARIAAPVLTEEVALEAR
jgi:hypothetical protein